MAAAVGEIVVNIKAHVEPYLEEMRMLAARMEAAAAAMGEPIEGELAEAQSVAAAEGPSLGIIATTLVAGAAIAGSTTKRLTRRSLVTLGFLRGR